jgi:Ser/Thr protein kinase RdoA (MazF antagonist)
MSIDQELRTARPAVGDARWVREAVARHWGPAWASVPPRPLRGPGGAPPLSHTAGLWCLTHRGTRYLFKVQLQPEALRGPVFPALKQRVLTHCADRGVPLPSAVPTASGAVAAWHDGHLCEVIPLLPGNAARTPSAAQATAVLETGFALRAALDEVDAELAADLAPVPLPALVAEENWGDALTEARTRLLPAARRRTDSWGRAAERALSALLAAEPLLRDAAEQLSPPPGRRAVVHGDLHYHHFLLTGDPVAEARVTAVLDFDNLHVGDRLLDLAWVAETTGRAGGTGPDAERAAVRFRAAARRTGLLAEEHLPLLMPVLIAHAVPVVVDIAKDILERDDLSPAWLGYFELLDARRRVHLHRLLTR